MAPDTPGHSYCENLARFGLETLQSRRESPCLKLFQSILSDERFSNLFPRDTRPLTILDTRIVLPYHVFAQTVIKDLLSQQCTNILIRSFKYISHRHLYF